MARFFLTTAIDYVNSRPHLGTAYEKVTADVIARYHRLCGHDTHFLMGNDEHSQNVFRRAREQQLDPIVYCAQMEQAFRDVWASLDVSFDDFIRTTETRHKAGVQRLVERCAAAGDVYDGDYEGWYCVSCESFKQEKDLVEGMCPVHLTKPDWIRERNHFFRLSRYRDRLLQVFHERPDFVQPDIRRNELLRLLEGGLDDISISRAGQSWGIPMPGDPNSVVYVWFDALINYISAVGYGTDDERFAAQWPADLHVVGKDITRFHAVVWPAMLMSAGLELPRQVFGHGWVHFKGQRMSKSLGTVVDPLEAVSRLGADPLRLYLTKEIPYGGDGDFSWERFEDRYNADLANNLGNLVSRVVSMVDRYQAGEVIPSALGSGRLAQVADTSRGDYVTAMQHLQLHEAAAAAFRLVDATNEYIAASEPWAMAKRVDQAEHLRQVLYDATEAVRVVATLLLPFIPASAREILQRVGDRRPAHARRFSDDAAWQSGVRRHVLKAPALWPRLDSPTRPDSSDGRPTEMTRVTITPPPTPPQEPPSEGAAPASNQPAPPASAPGADATAAPPATPAPIARISIDDFLKVELRVARVLTAERLPKSKKLLKLTVDVGAEQRSLVAGIAEAYEPEALVGRTVAMVFNLQPATLMGVESNGMILAASGDDGRPELVSFVNPPKAGTRIR